MSVKIHCTIDLHKNGDLRIRHDVAKDADNLDDRFDRVSIFGIPNPAKLTDKDRKEILDNLPGWVVGRFLYEAHAAAREVQNNNKT
jgi:hypothetical protein